MEGRRIRRRGIGGYMEVDKEGWMNRSMDEE